MANARRNHKNGFTVSDLYRKIKLDFDKITRPPTFITEVWIKLCPLTHKKCPDIPEMSTVCTKKKSKKEYRTINLCILKTFRLHEQGTLVEMNEIRYRRWNVQKM